MIDALFQELAIKARARTGVTEALVLWAFAVAILLLFALVFLSVAAYLWLADLYGGAIAGLTVGCVHCLLAVIAAANCIRMRRRNKALALTELKSEEKRAPWWTDPAVLTVGLEIARIVGWRKIAPFVTAGLLAATLGGARNGRDRSARDDRVHRAQ